MKKIFLPFALAAALLAVSCNKNVDVTDETGEQLLHEVELTINAKPVMAETKTYIEKSGSVYTPYWKNGDKLCIMNLSDLSSKKTFTNGAADGADATFTGSVGLADGSNTLYGFYPQNVTKIDRSEAVYKLSWGEDNDKQTLPSLTSFDPLHDIMVAKPLVVVSDGASTKTTVEMQFKRIMAVVKLILVDDTTNGYLDAAKVTSVKLTSSTQNLAGRISFDTSSSDASVTAIDGTVSKSVTASYSGDDFAINGTNAAFILIPPVTLPSGSTLTVDVVTDDATLTISKAVPLSKDFIFDEGIVTPLTVSLTDACVEKIVGPSLSVLVSSVSGISYDGSSTNTVASAYTITSGDDSDIVKTCDGTVVTAVSVSGGTVTYTTSTNSGVSRSGWIGLQAGSGDVQKITVNQAYNPSNVTAYTWDFTADKATAGTPATSKYYLYESGSWAEAETHTALNKLYFYTGKGPKFVTKSKTVAPKDTYYYFQYGGNADYLFFNSEHAGQVIVYATVGNTSGAASMDVKINGVASGDTKALDYYDTTKEYLGAIAYSWPIANTSGDTQEIQLIKSSGDKSPWVYKVVFESIN